ncbi:MAG: ATP-binding protein [Candidatus Eisenbacteria sp.]|nr:ATP-binding protein [Candidatus Eisenbacteria bacterium]
MYHPRSLDSVLSEWLKSPNRKPLILKGARQTGKSTTVRELGKQAQFFIELNLERGKDLSLVQSCESVEELLMVLATRHNVETFPDKTLLFLDEIQECPKLIQWLRFFQEDHPDVAVIAAGSLLEVRLQERGFSFPVGRVTFRTLHPFTYLEFLNALGKDALVEKLLGALLHRRPTPKPLHDQALALLRHYFLVGGMPEAVLAWTTTSRPNAVREIHADLMQAFQEDFQKYRGVRDLNHLEAAFENLKYHAGGRFSYENFAPGHRSQAMKTALGRLESALLITRVLPSSSLDLPLRPRQKSAPKLLPLDTGLMLSSIGTPIEDLRTIPFDRLIGGRLAEMFVGQQLLAGRPGRHEPLYFWVSESSRGSAEVDYLLPGAGVPVPIEVKAGASGTLRSLHQFLWRAGLRNGLRLYSGRLADQTLQVSLSGNELKYQLLSVPIYLAQAVWEIV